MLTVIRAAEDPDRFETWCHKEGFTTIESHPTYGTHGRLYFPATLGPAYRNISFAITNGDQPLMIVFCAVGHCTIDYWGLPIIFFPRLGLAAAESAAVIARAFLHLDELTKEFSASRIVIRDDSSGSTLSLLGEQCLSHRYKAEVQLAGLADLTEGETGLRRGLRKSYKSLLNWGKRNLTMEYVGKENPDRALFQNFQDFHCTVAGRSTRPQASWDTSFNWITAGGGELVLGFLPGNELVAGTLVIDGTETACYATGVYDRQQFDKPLAHWCLWGAMLRAGERGMSYFDLGFLPPFGTVDDKEFSIGYFKRGFATSIVTRLIWTWQAPPEQREPCRDT
jgi:hypothetical protein